MTHIPNGSFKNMQTLVTSHTSVQTSSSVGNAFITLDGSEITYTPSTSASNVVYEIVFYCQNSGYPFICAYLENADVGNTNWSEIHEKYRKNFGVSGYSTQTNRFYTTWRYVLPIWSGPKQLRIRIGSHNANRQINLHQLTEWDGAGSVTNKFCNTNLIVYSI
jgi:hypothetical protein